MRTVWRVLTMGGTIVATLLVLPSYSAAQDTSPRLRTLYSFRGGSDGSAPIDGVVIGPGRVLYGTTEVGGTSNNGTVFSLTPPASPGGVWTEVVLHSFAGAPNDGATPTASVAIGPDGALYGTTYYGGTFNNGTVFSLTPPASPGGQWTETVLHSFTGAPNRGANPEAGLVIGRGGVLYGTTFAGGVANGFINGTVFTLIPPASPGGPWTETVIHSFSGSDGGNPFGGVVIGGGEVLYGATLDGGTAGGGTVFSLTPPAHAGGTWTEAELYSFSGGGEGGNPYGGVVIGNGGELYGTTFGGGASNFGTAFSLTPPASPAGSWTETVLHNFGDSPHDGMSPTSTLAIGSDGVLYGTTQSGGSPSSICPEGMGSCGTVFSLKPPASSGSAWTESILHSFNSTDGAGPFAGVVVGRGTLYGTTTSGGTANSGTVFALMP